MAIASYFEPLLQLWLSYWFDVFSESAALRGWKRVIPPRNRASQKRKQKTPARHGPAQAVQAGMQDGMELVISKLDLAIRYSKAAAENTKDS